MASTTNTTNPSTTTAPPQTPATPNSTANTAPSTTDPEYGDSPAVNDPSLPEQHHAGKVGYGPNYRATATLEEKISGIKEEIMGKLKHDPALVEHGRSLVSGAEHRKKLTGEDEPNPFQNAEEDKSKDKDKDSPDTNATAANATDAGSTAGVDHTDSTTATGGPPAAPGVVDPAHKQSQTQPRARTPSPSPTRTRDAPTTETLRMGDAHPTPTSTSDSPSPARSPAAWSEADPNASTTPNERPTVPLSDATGTTGTAHASPTGMAAQGGHGDAAWEQAATVAPEGTDAAEKQRAGHGRDAMKHIDARN